MPSSFELRSWLCSAHLVASLWAVNRGRLLQFQLVSSRLVPGGPGFWARRTDTASVCISSPHCPQGTALLASRGAGKCALTVGQSLLLYSSEQGGHLALWTEHRDSCKNSTRDPELQPVELSGPRPQHSGIKGGGSRWSQLQEGPCGEFGRELAKRDRQEGKSINVHLTWFQIS